MTGSDVPIVLGPGEGRRYDMGAPRAVFKADGPEVSGRISVSEWWLDARHEGPGAHKHDDNEECSRCWKARPRS